MLRLIKILVSAALIGILIWNAEWSELKSGFRSMDPALIVLAVLLLSLQYPVSAWKWQVSLRLHGIEYSYIHLLRILCFAFFFNNFLPTAIGGDAYRAYRTMGKSTRNAYPISAVILERLMGIVALLFLGYLSAIFLIAKGRLVHHDWFVIAAGLGTLGILGLLLLWQFDIHKKIVIGFSKIAKLEPLYDSLRILGTNKQHFASLISISLLFQGLAIVTIMILFAALDLPGKFFESGFTAAAAGVAGVLPLSINGIGVVEGSFVAAAWESGLPYADAIIVALFLRVFMLASSIVFGLIYALEPKAERIIPKESTP